MPHSLRRRIAALRAAYTGETTAHAMPGVPRQGLDHGLDSCTDAQRTLRALLAVGVFNHGVHGAPPRSWSAARLTAYRFHVSPRHDDTVLFVDNPENAARCFVTWRTSTPVFPGFRAVCVSDHVRLVHIPTGAVFTLRPEHDRGRWRCTAPCPDSRHEKYQTPENAVTDEEHTDLGAIPPMSEDARTLLAALFVRMSLTAPDLAWATGGWRIPPQGVISQAADGADTDRLLWGSRHRWTLQWQGFPDADFVAAALTDPAIGLARARLDRAGKHATIRYSQAALALEKTSVPLMASLRGKRMRSDLKRSLRSLTDSPKP